MKSISIFSIFVLILLPACTVNKTLVPTGGSRADGVVRLSYEYSNFEQPQLNRQQGIAAASERCRAWGYESAEPFGGFRRECSNASFTGRCNAWIVTIEYQCLGSASSTVNR